MREVVGDRTVDEVLTIGRQDIEATAQLKLQDTVNRYEMGLRIDQIQLKNGTHRSRFRLPLIASTKPSRSANI